VPFKNKKIKNLNANPKQFQNRVGNALFMPVKEA
jgi:hypothetical protein